MDKARVTRRGFLLGASALTLGGCDQLSESETMQKIFRAQERVTEAAQRPLLDANALAQEYTEADISAYFKPNGSTDPQDPDYRAMVKGNFADWTLDVGGLVENPLKLSLEELRKRPSRTQITRHDCVEGWSCIGKWTGAKLSALLDEAKLKPQARYIVFHCADSLGGFNAAKYYESIAIADAYHPQTILAYDMNGETLTVPHGAPLRLRLERQLGYKMAKYIMGVEAVANLDGIGQGMGGYWEDRGYAWYAGI